MNRLKNQRVYLAGAMDRVKDRGASWRENISPFLQNLGINVFNPLIKPTNIGLEDYHVGLMKKQLKENHRYNELADIMKTIRNTDLRLVDISDFIIVNLNLEHYACGTWEEVSLANRSKKPIIIHMEQGKQNAPDWLFAMIPHEMIFSSWEQIKNYLNHINSDKNIDAYNRWQFFYNA
jgi:nucleoside 2-deoxyribosyltransferase